MKFLEIVQQNWKLKWFIQWIVLLHSNHKKVITNQTKTENKSNNKREKKEGQKKLYCKKDRTNKHKAKQNKKKTQINIVYNWPSK